MYIYIYIHINESATTVISSVKNRKKEKRKKMRLNPKKVDWGKLFRKCSIRRVTSPELLCSYIRQGMMHCVFLAIEIAF